MTTLPVRSGLFDENEEANADDTMADGSRRSAIQRQSRRGRKKETVRYMWMMVFFDLPVKEKEQRRHATRFRSFLKKDGYMMLQLSVYARVVRGEDSVEKHQRRIRANLPPKGSVRVLTVTERQYARMKLLVGDAEKNEKIGAKQMLLL